MKAIILAGGFGTRLKDALDATTPKSMAPVAGEPILSHFLRHLKRSGITEAMISLHHMAPSIMLHFGHEFEGLRLNYAVEHEALGTGGAIKYALSLMRPEQDIFVSNGDTFIDLNLAQMREHHRVANRPLTIAAREVKNCARYGEMKLDAAGTLTKFQYPGSKKPGLISTGCYILRPDLFDGYTLPAHFSFEADFKAPNIEKLKPAAYITDAYFVDIGLPEDYAKAQAELPKKLELTLV